MFVWQSSSTKASKPGLSLTPRRSSSLIFTVHFQALLLLFLTRNVLADLELPDLGFNNPDISSDDRSDGCETCSLLVKSFEKGLDRTMRGKHEGGDTSWEERNLKSYADSEVRLVEIQDDLCNELSTGKAQCLMMAEAGEHIIEKWWFEERNKNVRLHDYLCIAKLKKCCPEKTFGPTCQKCPECDGHGKCDGSGTRSGSGECNCNQGYKGKLCDECDDNFYSSRFGSEGKFECLKCHRACRGGCSGPTSINCTECAAGYARDPATSLCEDINECELGPGDLNLDPSRLCKEGTFCENTEGHYKCSPCHRVCQTCLGYGPDKCLTCANDFEMDENHTCIHFSEQLAEQSLYFYLVMEIIAMIIINLVTFELIGYLTHRFGFSFRMIAFLRTNAVILLGIVTTRLNLGRFIRSGLERLLIIIIKLIRDRAATESASAHVQSNVTQNVEF